MTSIPHVFLPLASHLNYLFIDAIVCLGILYTISGFDDLFIDLIAWTARLKPRFLNAREMRTMRSRPQANIAIIVPAWHEGNIIDRMLAGNLARIKYRRFHIFVGVYPNDQATVEKVKEVSQKHPNVHAVENFKPGPTSKGQILNHVIRQIIHLEPQLGVRFDAFLMQDAEDLIHPLTLSLVNSRLRQVDFLQIPVFSLEVKKSELVAGTYVDEFAEYHTKDILVRNKLGAAVPSAGVGTALSRRLVWHFMTHGVDGLFSENTVTEDYELGVRSHAAGFRSEFAAISFLNEEGKRDFIATREYFPKKFSRSVRQKARWTVGISMQGWKNLGWVGGASNLYFLARDRKGPLTNIATFLGYPLVVFTALYAIAIDGTAMHHTFGQPVMQVLLMTNLVLMLNRILQRAICVSRVYGPAPLTALLIRWPLGNTINALASFQAVRNMFNATVKKAHIAWVKTEHELPELFGQATAGKVGVAR